MAKTILGLLFALSLLSAPVAQAGSEDAFVLDLFPIFAIDNDVDILLFPGITSVAVVADGDLGGFTAGNAQLSQSVVGNTIVEDGVHHSNAVVDSFQNGVGVFDFNQDNGSSNNQANLRVFAFSRSAGAQYVEVTTFAERRDNSVQSTGGSRENRIEGSYNRTQGVVGINQAAGLANIQGNVLVATVGLDIAGGALLLSDSSLAAVFPTPTDLENAEEIATVGQPRTDTFTDSFVGFRGIAQVSMTSGDLNVSQNVIGVSFVPIGGTP